MSEASSSTNTLRSNSNIQKLLPPSIIVPEHCSPFETIAIHCRGIATQYKTQMQCFHFGSGTSKESWTHSELCVIEYEMQNLNRFLQQAVPNSDMLKFGLLFSCFSFGLSMLPFGIALATLVQKTEQYIRGRNRKHLLPKGLHMKLIRDKGSKDGYQTYVLFTRLINEKQGAGILHQQVVSDSDGSQTPKSLKSTGSERSMY